MASKARTESFAGTTAEVAAASSTSTKPVLVEFEPARDVHVQWPNLPHDTLNRCHRILTCDDAGVMCYSKHTACRPSSSLLGYP